MTVTAAIDAAAAARHVVGDRDLRDFEPAAEVAPLGQFFVDDRDEVLVVVSAPELDERDSDAVLAHALAWQGDRDLHVVLPVRLTERVLARLPWVATPVRVWSLDGEGSPSLCTVPSRALVLEWVAGHHPLRERATGTPRPETATMTATLATTAPRAMALMTMDPAWPAWTRDGDPEVVDFLGTDATGVFHVVSCAVAADPAIVLRALDQVIWATAHDAGLRAAAGVDPLEPLHTPVLDLVLAPGPGGESAVGPLLVPQLEALAPDVTWRIFIMTDPNAPVEPKPALPALLWRTVAPWYTQPLNGPRWSHRVERDMDHHAKQNPRTSRFRPGDRAVAHPGAERVFTDVRSRGVLHRHSPHATSGQAFTYNLFGPLEEAGLRGLWSMLGHEASELPAASFEVEVAERDTFRIPVMLRTVDAAGQRVVVAIETSYAEAGLSGSGPLTPERTLTLALRLLGGGVDRLVVALCTPEGNRAARRRFEEFRARVGHVEGVELVGLDAGQVADLHADGGAVFRELYPGLV